MKPLRDRDPSPLRVTDCCARLLPVAMTLIGDVHFPDLCLACVTLAGHGSEPHPSLTDLPDHDRHVTCDWSRGVVCPGRDWTYARPSP